MKGRVENGTTHRLIRRDASKRSGVFRPVVRGVMKLARGWLQLEPNMHSEGDCTITSDSP
jgi:hypothetical protein